MKKSIVAIGAVAVVVALTFLWAWLEVYNNTKWIFQEAMQHYDNGEYAWAVKGDQKQKERGKSYYFGVGFQNVVEIWRKAPGILRPDLYKKSVAMIDDIIGEKMSEEDLQNMIEKYSGSDNKYLLEARIRIGDIRFENGDWEGALKIYNQVRDRYGDDESIMTSIEYKITQCEIKVADK